MKWFILILLLIMTAGLTLASPAPATAHSSDLYPFSHLIIDNQPYEGIVVAIGQDDLGFIWFGGTNGLNRFDGVLWISTQEGLNRNDAATVTFQRFLHDPLDSSSLSNNQIEAIIEGPSDIFNDDIWNELGTSITIRVTPPWWLTTWFRITVIVLSAGILLLAYNIHTSRFRQQVEEELRASEARYRTIIEASGTAMAIVAENFSILLVNQEYERLSGYSREELESGMKWAEFVHPEDVDRVMGYNQQRWKPFPRETPRRNSCIILA